MHPSLPSRCAPRVVRMRRDGEVSPIGMVMEEGVVKECAASMEALL
jgi:hypothetical protein